MCYTYFGKKIAVSRGRNVEQMYLGGEYYGLKQKT